MESHKKAELHFVHMVSLCVGDVQCPKGAMTEAQQGLRERNMSLYSVRNVLLRFRRISGVNILVQKNGFPPFGERLASLDQTYIETTFTVYKQNTHQRRECFGRNIPWYPQYTVMCDICLKSSQTSFVPRTFKSSELDSDFPRTQVQVLDLHSTINISPGRPLFEYTVTNTGKLSAHQRCFMPSASVVMLPTYWSERASGLNRRCAGLKVHNVFPKVTFPPWLHPVKIWLHTVSG